MIDVPLETVADLDDPRLAQTFITLKVNGSPVRALLDTGARRSALVYRPGLFVTEAAAETGTGAFGAASQAQRTSASVRLAGRDLGMVECSVVPIGHPGHGDLIGQDVLSQFRCEYRLAEGRLRLDGDLPDAVTPIHLDAGCHIYLDASWSGVATHANAVFDTGASVTVVDQRFFSARPELFSSTGTSAGTDASGAVVETPLAMMRGPVILQRHLSDSLVAVVNLEAANSTVEWPMDLILGWPIIRQAVWVFDHAERVAACSLISDIVPGG